MTQPPELLFEVRPRKAGRPATVVEIRAKGNRHIMGQIRWDSGWKRYVFVPLADTGWTLESLEAVVKQLGSMREDRLDA